jgi:hypothetical protein
LLKTIADPVERAKIEALLREEEAKQKKPKKNMQRNSFAQSPFNQD